MASKLGGMGNGTPLPVSPSPNPLPQPPSGDQNIAHRRKPWVYYHHNNQPQRGDRNSARSRRRSSQRRIGLTYAPQWKDDLIFLERRRMNQHDEQTATASVDQQSEQSATSRARPAEIALHALFERIESRG